MRFDDEADLPVRRGRLTDHERLSLLNARVELEDALAVPLGADRWSTWGQGEMGPEPLPDWVITSEGAVDTELGVVKTGKEAEVFLVRRELPGGPSVLLAEKRYRSSDHRLFHRDAGYLEGRRMKESRMSRAVANRTSFGRKLISEQWAAAEFAALCGLWTAGAPVPYPVQRVGTDLLLEFIGDSDGGAAPRLAQLRPDPDSLADLWGQLREGLGALARAGFTHGDLSAYNVLVYQGQLVLIDLPQVVDVVVNPRGRELMERDVRNIGTWFAARGLRDAEGEMREMVDYVGGEAGLGWRSEEGGGDGEGGEDAGAGAGAEEKVMGGEGV
ncbi:MAG TPA: RIO1 family regulatory kinase/ATPase [Actinocrinis sp.]|jgi:RIO kinase 1|nr:RIO1 family regulatory kinase/ATPase [Actinocrinis sp.]HEV3172932.1 RIO1 family regulatory kinase/ATPase [Actinocrinis sp.]